MESALNGADVIKTLAAIYQQLYVSPGVEGEREYADIVKRGRDAKSFSLSHFTLNPNDTLVYENTPVGTVPIVTLYERNDFETFLKIMANRCKDVELPATQGASIISGVINWTKINRHKEEFFKGDDTLDWNAEFKRFTSDSNNFKDTIIVLSVGPYSGVPANEVGYTKDEWLRYSDVIRRYHECTHFICRKLYPDMINPLWDELVADAVGIYAAFHRFDVAFAERFLGIKNRRYVGGRLENYVDEARLDELAVRIDDIYLKFHDIIKANEGVSPYELAIRLQQEYSVLFE